MSPMTRFKFFLWHFSHFKVAMIGYLKPRLIKLSETEIVVRLPLNRRSRNHLNSMYFGALAVGADLAAGLHAFYHADLARCKASLVFKSFKAEFLRRPESDVFFVCSEGATVKTMIQEAQASKERINRPISVKAYINYFDQPEEVADFILELSVKVV